MSTDPVTVIPVTGLPEISAGADLAGLIAAAVPDLRDGDILVVTSKVVSKAEGRVENAGAATVPAFSTRKPMVRPPTRVAPSTASPTTGRSPSVGGKRRKNASAWAKLNGGRGSSIPVIVAAGEVSVITT